MSAQCREPGPGGHPGASGAGPCPPGTVSAPWNLPRWRACLAVAVLCYINLLNYMNWFIIAGEEATAGGVLGSTCLLLTHGRPATSQHGASTVPSVLQTVSLWSTSLPFSLLEGVSAKPGGRGGIAFPIQPQPRPVHTGVGARWRWGRRGLQGGPSGEGLEVLGGMLSEVVEGRAAGLRNSWLGASGTVGCAQALHILTSFLEGPRAQPALLVTHTFP